VNLGYAQLGDPSDVMVRIYWDINFVPGPGETDQDAPLVDGPRGYCAEFVNVTGKRVTTTLYGVADTPMPITIGTGDPVTGGPTSGRSRTAAQLAALGYTTRGSVGSVSLGSE
jgi:hypothetical protein